MGNEVADEMRGFVRGMIDKVESDGAWWRAEARASVQGDARAAGDGGGEVGLTGRGVGRRRRCSNPNPEPGAI
jgi:hypothetical protein